MQQISDKHRQTAPTKPRTHGHNTQIVQKGNITIHTPDKDRIIHPDVTKVNDINNMQYIHISGNIKICTITSFFLSIEIVSINLDTEKLV